MQDRVGDHPLGRLDAAEEHHRGVRDDLAPLEPARIAAGGGEHRRAGLAVEHRLDGGPQVRERRPAGVGTSPPAVTSVTAATMASYQPRTAPVVRLAQPERMRHDGRGERTREGTSQVRLAPGAMASISRVDLRGHDLREAAPSPPRRRNGRANGARWRWCSGSSSVSMLGPTTRPVEKRGSSTVKVAASPMACSARSRRSDEPAAQGRQPCHRCASRRRASSA